GEKSIARMYGVDVRDLSGADHLGDVQITVGAACRANTYGFVGEAHVQSIAVRFRINCHRGDIQFLAGTDHTQGDFTTIRYQYLAEHRGKPASATSFWQDGWRIGLVHIRRAGRFLPSHAPAHRSRRLQFRSSIS